MHTITKDDNFTYLALSLLLLLAAIALAPHFFADSSQGFLQSFALVTLLISVWGVKIKAKTSKNIFSLSIIASFLLSNLNIHIDFEQNYSHLFLGLWFFISTAITTAKQVLLTVTIDNNKILDTIELFLLFGLIYAMISILIDLFSDNAFSGVNSRTDWYDMLPVS